MSPNVWFWCGPKSTAVEAGSWCWKIPLNRKPLNPTSYIPQSKNSLAAHAVPVSSWTASKEGSVAAAAKPALHRQCSHSNTPTLLGYWSTALIFPRFVISKDTYLQLYRLQPSLETTQSSFRCLGRAISPHCLSVQDIKHAPLAPAGGLTGSIAKLLRD